MRRPRAAAVAPLLLLLGASLSVSLSVSLSWQPAGAGEVAPPQEIVAGHVLRPLPLPAAGASPMRPAGQFFSPR